MTALDKTWERQSAESAEIVYDDRRCAQMLNDQDATTMEAAPESGEAGVDCHAGAPELRRAAEAAGKSETLQRYAADYPIGPHDQPQSMCPAFGSLRVGLRMRRTATVLSGSACCVYGLTFTSHFYGARRSVGYVPFNSETLVTGKLFEDIKQAARPRRSGSLRYGRHHQSLRADGVRRAAQALAGRDQRRADYRH